MNLISFVILFFGISPGELFLILLVILLLFGPRKIPEIARTLGRGLNELKKAQRDLNSEIKNYSGDIEKEGQNIKSEVESILDKRINEETSLKEEENKTKNRSDENKNLDKDNFQSSSDENNDANRDDDLDDLPYPYNRDLKA